MRATGRADAVEGHVNAEAVLTVEDLEAGYDPVRVLRLDRFVARPGQVTAVVGSNGAGKSTLLRAISGQATVFAGTLSLDGTDLRAIPPHERARAGVAHVAEGRRVLRRQTVEDNLRLGLFGIPMGRDEADTRIGEALDLFPVLRDRLRTVAAALSGGQLQMLALAQAFVRRPRLLLVDEPSLGLAPIVVDQVFDRLDRFRRAGLAVVLVEQMVEKALALADTAYVLQVGQVVASGTAPDLMDRSVLEQAYLGAASTAGPPGRPRR